MDQQIEARVAMAMHGVSLSAIGSTMSIVSGYVTNDQLRELAVMVRDIADDVSRLSEIACGSVVDDIIEKSKGFA